MSSYTLIEIYSSWAINGLVLCPTTWLLIHAGIKVKSCQRKESRRCVPPPHYPQNMMVYGSDEFACSFYLTKFRKGASNRRECASNGVTFVLYSCIHIAWYFLQDILTIYSFGRMHSPLLRKRAGHKYIVAWRLKWCNGRCRYKWK